MAVLLFIDAGSVAELQAHFAERDRYQSGDRPAPRYLNGPDNPKAMDMYWAPP
jgi:hypothetical protein